MGENISIKNGSSQVTTVQSPHPLAFWGAAVSNNMLNVQSFPAMSQSTEHLTSLQQDKVSKLVPLISTQCESRLTVQTDCDT